MWPVLAENTSGYYVVLDYRHDLAARFGQMGSRGSGDGCSIRGAATGSTGIALILFIQLAPVPKSAAAARAARRCEVLDGIVAFSAMLSSAMGYIGRRWDIPGQLAFMGENRTGVASVPGG
jgi:hypothetical protein